MCVGQLRQNRQDVIPLDSFLFLKRTNGIFDILRTLSRDGKAQNRDATIINQGASHRIPAPANLAPFHTKFVKFAKIVVLAGILENRTALQKPTLDFFLTKMAVIIESVSLRPSRCCVPHSLAFCFSDGFLANSFLKARISRFSRDFREFRGG